jgi:hypothetical protein
MRTDMARNLEMPPHGSPIRPRPSGKHRRNTTYEFAVAGPMGPTLRAAFPGHQFATLDPCTVVRLRDVGSRDLLEVLRLFESAQLSVCEVRQLTGDY